MFTFHQVQDFLQRGNVRPVTLKDFVGKRQTLLGDHHGQNQLQSIWPGITAVAAPRGRDLSGLAFKVGTSQIVEQQIALGSEQIPPTLGQVTLEGLFMFQRFIQCPVEPALAATASSIPSTTSMAVVAYQRW